MRSQVGVGPFQVPSGRSVVAALREDSTTFGLDGVHSLSFDRAGRLLRAFWEGRSIRLYLSPLAADPNSPYRQQEREANIRPLTEAETDAQLRALKAGLRFDPRDRPKVAIYDIRDFIY